MLLVFFFWSDAMAEAIAFGQMNQLKRQQASNHANQYKAMDSRCRNRPCSTYFQKPSPRACGSGCLAWPISARGCVFYLKLSKDNIIVDLAISNNNVYMAVAVGWTGLTCSWPYGHESVGCRQLGIETIPSRCCLKHIWCGGKRRGIITDLLWGGKRVDTILSEPR